MLAKIKEDQGDIAGNYTIFFSSCLFFSLLLDHNYIFAKSKVSYIVKQQCLL